MCLLFFTGENANISYSLLPGAGYEFFSIDSQSGHISTATKLDRELQHSFTLRGKNLWVMINHHDRAFKIPVTVLNE